MIVNMILFLAMAFYLAYREMVMLHPDSIPFLNLQL